MAVEMDGLQRKVEFCEVDEFHIMILFVDVDNEDHEYLDIDKGDDHATNLAKNGCYVLRVRIAVAPHWKFVYMRMMTGGFIFFGAEIGS